ncbi:MAG: hypothetical protein ACK2UB_13335 [Anaerolineales bacterium]
MTNRKSAKPRRNRAPFRARPQSNNRTGYNGVSVTYTKGNKGRTIMPVVSVYYKLKGKVHNKRFYIHLYPSKKAAIEDAVKFRRKMEREMLRERKARDARRKKKKR